MPDPTPTARLVMRTRLAGSTVLALAALAALVSGCDRGDASSARRDTAPVLVIATPADADALLPPLVATTQGKQTADLLFDNLATLRDSLVTVGDAGFAPQLARRWTWAPDSLSIAFELDPRARWHDGRPVRAPDVRFSHALYTDPAVGSPHARVFDGIDSVTVRDSLTAVVWWHRRNPEQFFQVAYNLAVLPEHVYGAVPRAALREAAVTRRPVGSGRYRFDGWAPHDRLAIAADTGNYRGRPTFDRVVWTITPDPASAALRVLSGQAHVLEALRGEAVAQAARTAAVRAVPYGSLDYGYMVFNTRARGGAARPHPLFGSRALRVAVSAAVDRRTAVTAALDSLGAVALGPLTRAHAASIDTVLRPIAFDSAAAARALDAEGWRLDAARGVRVRDGRPLEFALLVPSSSATRQRLAVILQAQLAKLGVRIVIDAMEATAFAERLQRGDFDAALGVWRADPSLATVRQSWGSPRPDDVGANFGRYASTAFDAVADSAAAEFDPARRRALFGRAMQVLLDDAPAVWLYEPRNLAAVSRTVTPVGMRADAWWARVADWRPAGAATVAAR